jgi:hypothetical protein
VGIIGDGPLLMPLFKMYTVVDVKEKLLHGLSLSLSLYTICMHAIIHS